jgi:Thermostable hemolysin
MLASKTISLTLPDFEDSLDAKAARRLARLLNPAPAFEAHLPGGAQRARVEQYIAERFHEVHGATIHDFMPVLLTMGCHGRTTAATGVRAAARQPLFLEQYLSGPVEQTLGSAVGAPIRRAGIAEIGNLVATQGGSSYLLFMVLTAMLEQAGFDWVVFTATPQVQKVLAYLGLDVHRLCSADPGRLTESSAAEWGSYYASQPQVVAGKVADAMTVLNQRTLYASVLSLFRGQITELAEVLRRESSRRGSYILAA